MNTQNYASLEASKRLHDTGIVLETDYYWCLDDSVGWYFRDESTFAFDVHESIPAASFAELWRELPDNVDLGRNKGINYAGLELESGGYKEFENINPADALAELLIWVKGEKK